MFDYENSIFISYAWGGESEEMVNRVDQALQSRGIKIIRDKRDVDYKGFISEFMERIGRGSCVIVVISDKYLRSKNCMYELVEIAENKEFVNRIFPIILQDAKIYDAVERVDYVKYWENEKEKLNEKIRDLKDLSNLQGIHEELDNYDRFRDRISGLTSILKDMNTLTPDKHRDSDFDALYTAIEKRMNIPGPVSGVAFNTLDFEPKTILIPAGTFLMGSEDSDNIPSFEGPQSKVALPAFRIGMYPVTNFQFEEFVRQTDFEVPASMCWDGLHFPEGLEDYPVTGITWYHALDYCRWLSDTTGHEYTLPTEAQWERACRGGKQTIYPWGDEFDPEYCNLGRKGLAPVTAYLAQNEFELFDLVGNIRQWTCSLWGEKGIAPDKRGSYPWTNDTRRNALDASSQVRRVVRGSAFTDDILSSRCSSRSSEQPGTTEYAGIGFRVLTPV